MRRPEPVTRMNTSLRPRSSLVDLENYATIWKTAQALFGTLAEITFGGTGCMVWLPCQGCEDDLHNLIKLAYLIK